MGNYEAILSPRLKTLVRTHKRLPFPRALFSVGPIPHLNRNVRFFQYEKAKSLDSGNIVLPLIQPFLFSGPAFVRKAFRALSQFSQRRPRISSFLVVMIVVRKLGAQGRRTSPATYSTFAFLPFPPRPGFCVFYPFTAGLVILFSPSLNITFYLFVFYGVKNFTITCVVVQLCVRLKCVHLW